MFKIAVILLMVFSSVQPVLAQTNPTGNLIELPTDTNPLQAATVYEVTFELQGCVKSEQTVTCQFRVKSAKDEDVPFKGASLFDEYGEEYKSGSNNKWVRLNGRLASKVETAPKTHLVADVPVCLLISFEQTPKEMSKISLLKVNVWSTTSVDMRNIALSAK